MRNLFARPCGGPKAIYPGQGGYNSSGYRIPCGVVRLSNLENMQKMKEKFAVFPTSPSLQFWFHTLNLPSSSSQMLKSPRRMPTALGYEGQCGTMRHNLSRDRLKVSSGSKVVITNHHVFFFFVQIENSQSDHGRGKSPCVSPPQRCQVESPRECNWPILPRFHSQGFSYQKTSIEEPPPGALADTHLSHVPLVDTQCCCCQGAS